MNRSENSADNFPVRYQESDSGRRIFVPLLLVLCISLSSYFYIFQFATENIDNQAQLEMKDRVEVALNIESRRLGDLLTEYAFWDVSHLNLIQKPDAKWADENIGSYMADNLSMALSIAVRGDDKESIAYRNGKEVKGVLPKIRQAGIDPLIALIRKNTRQPDPQNAFITVDGQLMLLAVDTFTPEFEDSPAADGSYLLIARSVTPDYIASIGDLYKIPNLRIARGPISDANLFHTITDLNKNAAVTLTWDERSPATAISYQVAMPLTGIFLLMVLISAWIIRMDIYRRQQQEKILRDLATHDPLTGIYNRRQFFQLAHQELGRTNREQSAMSLLILDIDHFKQINDQFGHLAGDQLLINTATVLSAGLREFDIIARYGGEEFVILLPNTNLNQANEIAERLREQVEETALQFENDSLNVTISIGITTYRFHEETRELLARADHALYAAKHAGRNRCRVASA
ncbi:sensor domain-containing diguanylate cyclase [Sedimenticola sp.]|uniref:sensor domain-containing diguanylate cyclase n=1 Tax=Sedimenticola sp. TaxID=1940285 RepID=UPI003D11EE86